EGGSAGAERAACGGRRPTPFSQGWTSQPGRFFDDVSLPDGFSYDVVASYRDPIADTFAWSDVAVGGPDPAAVKGFSSPDNLVFDRLGNLWMVTDISSGSFNEGVYAYHRNNGIFMIRVGGPDAGIAFRFGSVPNEAESTGPICTPDQTTTFLAIQHPDRKMTSGKAGGSRP
ncbi:MAG TPA: alkaline phosphatase PhoX, partial [Actinomycetota bacterium]|nr:alkaline phosphatase PhoX [Actinomycetota bacterium]